jgi:hypothetical protein
MNQPNSMITLSLSGKYSVLRFSASNKHQIRPKESSRQSARKSKHAIISTAQSEIISDFQSENSRFLELAQDRLGGEPTVKKVPGGCGDEDDLPSFIWTMVGAISYTTVVEHQFPVHPHSLVMCASFFLRSNENFLVMCASFLVL